MSPALTSLRTITLRAGDWRLEVDPARGGSILRCDWKGEPLMRPVCGTSIFDVACFPLVPFSNRIARGKFAAHGREVCLPPNFPGSDHPHPLHGFGWLAEWCTEALSDSAAELVHDRSDGEWPWPYRARQRLSVVDDRLIMMLSVENRAETDMPAGLGFHPYFPRTPDTLYHGLHRGEWRNTPDCLPVELVERPEPSDWWEDRSVGARTVDTVYTHRSGPLHITWPQRNLRLRIAPSPELEHTVVYTPASADFFCVEPVTHITDAVNRTGATGLRWLAPKDEMRCSIELRATHVS